MHCLLTLKSGLPQLMPNANQYQSMPIKILELIQNTSQSFLIGIGITSTILIGFDRYWSALGIDRGSPVKSNMAVMNFISDYLLCTNTLSLVFFCNLSTDDARIKLQALDYKVAIWHPTSTAGSQSVWVNIDSWWQILPIVWLRCRWFPNFG